MEPNNINLANTFRIDIKEGIIRLDFGRLDKDGTENVRILNSTDIDIKIIMPLIERLVLSAVSYQKDFDVDLGIKAESQIEEESGE